SIIEVLHHFIQEERKRSFCFLGMRSHCYLDQSDLLSVSPATTNEINAARKFDQDNRLAVYTESDWFNFKEVGSKGLIHIVAITILPFQTLAINNLIVTRLQQSSGTVETTLASIWIQETYYWNHAWAMRFEDMQYEELNLWWQGTGKVFKLLDLPLELREAIYLQCMGSIVLPDLIDSRVVLGRGWSFRNKARTGRNRDPDIERPNMTIMRLCLLSMPAASYFALVGITTSTTVPFSRTQLQFDFTVSIDLIKRAGFKSLKRLDFHFISPKHPDAVCPWALANDTHKDGEHSCQKAWIDWFFTFGWKKIKALGTTNHPVRFTLSGCVKNSSQTYWEKSLNDTNNNHTPTMKWIGHNLLKAKTNSNSLPCHCSTPCSTLGSVTCSSTFEWNQGDIRAIEGLQEHLDDVYWSYKN
ncbi:hypothetical protein GQ44DRAFT_632510, partial [Phaeosphaeriaceae sp. PMI808]